MKTVRDLSLGLLLVALSCSTLAAPCADKRPDRLIPEAGAKGTAMFPQEIIQREYQPPSLMAERGFDHVVGMFNAVTVYPCSRGRPATVEIQQFAIVRWDVDGRKLVTEATVRYDGRHSTYSIDGGQWKRQPEWFISGQPSPQLQVARKTGGLLYIDLTAIPEHIYHGWMDPRVKTVSGAHYGVIATVRITGDARLQLGMDYWKGSSSQNIGWSAGCVKSNNCEAWLSEWHGDTGGEFKLIVAPRSLMNMANSR